MSQTSNNNYHKSILQEQIEVKILIGDDRSMTIANEDYLNSGPIVEVEDLEYALNASRFDAAAHIRHSHGWGKVATTTEQVTTATSVSQVMFS